MKHSILHPLLCAALTFGVFTATSPAQSPGGDPTNPPNAGGPPPPPPGHHGPPPSPLFRALDANGDGVISADEIANASAALKTLADASGQITRESIRPPHPPRDDQKTAGDDRPHPHRPPPPDASRDDAAGSPAPRPPHPDADHGPRKQDASPSPDASPTASASAPADGPAGHHHHGPPHGDGLFDALDTNHDGVISADEINSAAAALKKADTNGDGVIDRRDFRPPPPPPHAPEE